jgi:AcrR family transcriptional regulator
MAHKKTAQIQAMTVRKTPKQRRAKLLVESILEASARILEDGVEPFTTNHIAKRAGVSIGSLYQYFPSADAIMTALIEKHVADEVGAAEAILENAGDNDGDLMRDLLIAFVNAHADAPRLTARLHGLASSFGLQSHLTQARDEQALRIAQVMNFPKDDIRISVMAVEGVVLAMLASDPAQLKSKAFIDKLYAVALAPLVVDGGMHEL